MLSAQRLYYEAGGIWRIETTPSEAFRGFFDPTLPFGGPNASFPVVNGSTEYEAGNYLLVTGTGGFDFDTGQPSPTAPVVTASNFIIYDSSLTWRIIGDVDTLDRGFFDPTKTGGQPPAPHQVIDGSTLFKQGEFMFAIATGDYDFFRGSPTRAAPTSGRSTSRPARA